MSAASSSTSAPAVSGGASAASSSPPTRAAFYRTLEADVLAQLDSSPHRDPLALCANVAALLYHSYGAEFGERGAAVNWAGVYLLRNILPDAANIEASAGDDDGSIADGGLPYAEGAAASETAPAPPTRALLLGPFHGQPAVSLIRVGRGVCGAAAASGLTQLVPDVHARPDHIACDSASRSELVIPLYAAPDGEGEEGAAAAGGEGTGVAPSPTASDAASSPSSSPSLSPSPSPLPLASSRRLVGVLDMDSPLLSFFSEEDARALERIADALGRKADWSLLEAPLAVRFPTDTTCTLSRKPKPTAAAANAAH